MADLDLTRRGPAQVDRVVVNPGRARMPKRDRGTSDFLNQISQLSDTLSGVLAKRMAEKRKLEEQEMYRQARIAAFDPVGFERGLADGTYNEWDHPNWQVAVDGYKAEADAIKMAGDFEAFDPSQGPEAAEEFIAEQAQTASQNPSSAYQAAVLPIVARLGADLRSRVTAHQLRVQREETIANFMSGTSAALREAIEAGAPPETLYAALDERMAVAVSTGISRADAATGLLKAAQAIVSEDPRLEDVLNDYVVPTIGRLEDVAPGAISGAASAARRAIRAEQRAIRAEHRAQLREASEDAQRRVWAAVARGEQPDAADIQMGSYSDPNFVLDVQKAVREASKGVWPGVLDPELYASLRVRADTGDLSYQEIYDNRYRLSQEKYDTLVNAVSRAKKGGSHALSSPVYTKILAPVLRQAETMRLSKDITDGMTVNERTAYREAERQIIQQTFDEMTAVWADVDASDTDEAQKMEIATKLREAALADIQARVGSLQYEPRFRKSTNADGIMQPSPPEAKSIFDRVPGAEDVYQRLPAFSGLEPGGERILPSDVDTLVDLLTEGSELPDKFSAFLQDVRIQLSIPPGVPDIAIVTALDVHLNGVEVEPEATTDKKPTPIEEQSIFQRLRAIAPQSGPGY